MELCEEAFIESCFEELFEEEDRFAEELEQFLSNLTQEQVGNLVHQLDAVSLSSSQPASDDDVTAKVFLLPPCSTALSVWFSLDAPVFCILVS